MITAHDELRFMPLARDIALIVHDIIRAFNATYGDRSLPAWESLPENLKHSTIHGVIAVLKNPQVTPAQQHTSWMAMRKADGWKYGPIKSMAKKTNPAMVPYAKLPPHQKIKDILFRQVVLNTVYSLPKSHKGRALLARSPKWQAVFKSFKPTR